MARPFLPKFQAVHFTTERRRRGSVQLSADLILIA
jgi:hypothetical protein